MAKLQKNLTATTCQFHAPEGERRDNLSLVLVSALLSLPPSFSLVNFTLITKSPAQNKENKRLFPSLALVQNNSLFFPIPLSPKHALTSTFKMYKDRAASIFSFQLEIQRQINAFFFSLLSSPTPSPWQIGYTLNKRQMAPPPQPTLLSRPLKHNNTEPPALSTVHSPNANATAALAVLAAFGPP